MRRSCSARAPPTIPIETCMAMVGVPVAIASKTSKIVPPTPNARRFIASLGPLFRLTYETQHLKGALWCGGMHDWTRAADLQCPCA